jgi:hypothetical protein
MSSLNLQKISFEQTTLEKLGGVMNFARIFMFLNQYAESNYEISNIYNAYFFAYIGKK